MNEPVLLENSQTCLAHARPAQGSTVAVEILVLGPRELSTHAPASPSETFDSSCSANRRWLSVLQAGLRHKPYLLQARQGERLVGELPLAFVKSALFGRFLVSLPYVNSAGITAESDGIAGMLVDSAVALADRLNVRYLELRQEREVSHAALTEKNDSKVIMRLALPPTVDALWNSFKSKLRSQIRSGQKHNFEVAFGQADLLSEFYAVFSRNMRDLGTPVYSRALFEQILHHFQDEAELCVLRLAGKPVAAALLLHAATGTEVPSASSLREYNSTSANMVMYWHLLERAVQKGQKVFDFGRSTHDSNTFRFKKQWGAEPHPSIWQSYVRHGSARALRPDNGKFGLAIRIWQRLPLWLSRMAGPAIVRGIP